ncbi:DUF2971 domain-containing protein [uncultured Aeromonas sp.]|uniref:DUF2971 domain-containing protein n=1 Tax=uncultured Aeromonas sp. TaxID=263763 RepID=UPI00258E4EF4|nr:DUF2971 domain-containing protein [uncultured Aeromonas sp.]
MMDEDNDKEFFRYKYVPFGADKLSLNIISQGSIKLTCPLDFNDPFDCQPLVSTELLHETGGFNKANALLLDKKLEHSEYVLQRDKMLSDLKLRIHSGEYITALLKCIGVLSLSRQYDNALMWSHYADYHKGFVVGFRYSKPEDLQENVEDTRVEQIIPYIVNYSKNKPVYTLSSKAFDMSILLTKDAVWGYENEERTFTWGEMPGIHKYDRAKRLHCVIAGAKISKDDLGLLRNAVQQASKELGRKIKFKQARLSEKTYDLEFVDIEYKYKK